MPVSSLTMTSKLAVWSRLKAIPAQKSTKRHGHSSHAELDASHLFFLPLRRNLLPGSIRDFHFRSDRRKEWRFHFHRNARLDEGADTPLRTGLGHGCAGDSDSLHCWTQDEVLLYNQEFIH